MKPLFVLLCLHTHACTYIYIISEVENKNYEGLTELDLTALDRTKYILGIGKVDSQRLFER